MTANHKKPAITGTQSKAADLYAIRTLGIPSLTLMENASAAAAECIMSEHPARGKVLVCCGVGNNGADGICIGRILKEHGYEVTLYICGDEKKATEEFRAQKAAFAKACGVPVPEGEGPEDPLFTALFTPFLHDTILPDCDVLVDAVFGIGLHRPVEGLYREFIAEMVCVENDLVAAVDIPSGIDSDTGEVMGLAVTADLTVTFGRTKTGLIRGAGKDYAGRVVVKDIGIPREAYEEALKG